MESASRERARDIWRQLAARNQWQLFPDEGALLDEALAASQGGAAGDAGARLRAALQRRYSERLYTGIGEREERAAYELWLMFVRLAVRGGVAEQDAEDLAQEAVARVLEKQGQVRSPQGFLAWAMMVFRTTERDLRPKRGEQPLPATPEEPAAGPPDPGDLAAEVEGRLLEQELRDLLRAAVPNDLERLTVLRCIILGDDPRDVARDLGLPLHRTRVAKSRALQRLRGSAAFMAFISSLTAAKLPSEHATGGQGDD